MTKVIRQPSPLTFTRHNLNVPEKRIIYKIIESIQNRLQRNVVVQDLFNSEKKILVDINTTDLVPNGNKNRSHIKAALKRLSAIQFDVVGEDKRGTYDTTAKVIKDFKHYKNKPIIEIEIDEKMKDFYFELASGYTNYKLAIAFNSSSAYTMKLYEFLSAFKTKDNINNKNWSLSYLCDYFGVPDSYRRFSKFDEKILRPAASELNSNDESDINFSYEGIKKGRKIEDVSFTIKHDSRRTLTGLEVAEKIQGNAAITMVLKNQFSFSKNDFIEVQGVLADPILQENIFKTIERVKLEIETGKVEHPRAYLKKAINNLLI